MVHSYKITGISCDDNRIKVEKALNAINGISAVVTLDPMEAIISMEKHVPTEKLQEVLSIAGNYSIEMNPHPSQHAQGNIPPHRQNVQSNHSHGNQRRETMVLKLPAANSGGKYYCPMHCEGDKLYDEPGNCPVCGMNLEKCRN